MNREPQPIREPHELPGAPLRHPVEHLTDNYRKGEDSNNYKLLDLDHAENAKIWRTLQLIEMWRDMDDAEGFTLDKIGKNVLELREGRADPEYRKAIKIKIRGNLSAGLIEDLNVIAAVLFGDNFVSVTETWYQPDYNNEPAAVAIHLHNSIMGLDDQFWRDIFFISDIVKAGGVGIYNRLTQTHEVNTYDASMANVFTREYFIEPENPPPVDVPTYDIAVMNVMLREYIVVDIEPFPADFTTYDAAVASMVVNEFAAEAFPMPDIAQIFHATGVMQTQRDFVSEAFEIDGSVKDYAAAAPYEIRKEEYRE